MLYRKKKNQIENLNDAYQSHITNCHNKIKEWLQSGLLTGRIILNLHKSMYRKAY